MNLELKLCSIKIVFVFELEQTKRYRSARDGSERRGRLSCWRRNAVLVDKTYDELYPVLRPGDST